MKSLFKRKKEWLVGLIIAVMFLNLIYNIAWLVNRHDNSVSVYFYSIFSMLVQAAFFLLGFYMVYRDDKFWMKTMFVAYFGYLFMCNLFTVFSHWLSFEHGSAADVCIGVFGFILGLTTIAIGIVYVLGLSGKLKSDRIIELLVLARIAECFIIFILNIIRLADYRIFGSSWHLLITPVTDILVTLVFYIGYDYDAVKAPEKSSAGK